MGEPFPLVLEMIGAIMATLDNLEASVAKLTSDEAANAAVEQSNAVLLTNLLTAVTASGVQDPRIDAAVAAINTATAGLEASTADLTSTDATAQAGLTTETEAATTTVDPNAPVDPASVDAPAV